MENTMRPIIKKHLHIELRYKAIMDLIGNDMILAKEVVKKLEMPMGSVYFMLENLNKSNHLSITRRKRKTGKGTLNYYSATGIEFIPKTVEELEGMYPEGYISKMHSKNKLPDKSNEKGPYDDMIASNPNLRKITAMFETHPHLFKQEKRKSERYGIPSTFGMYNMMPTSI